ncbi:MAG: PEPxxWA-CTERM sorting domain-containing protein [Sphingomicrobium sp.]
MHLSSIKRLRLISAASAATVLLGVPATAQNVVVPTGLENVEGNSGSRNVLGFINVARLQQVYDADQFSQGAITITGVSFRTNGETFAGLFGTPGTAFTRTTQGFQVQLSTTSASADNLSTSFSANTGSNVVSVIPRSDVTYSTAAMSSNGTTRDFDVTFNFLNAFVYDPSMGNLLLDLTSFGGSNRSGATLDGQNVLGDGTSSLFLQNGTGGNGATNTFGYVTRFQTAAVTGAVPEPGTWAMMLLGFGAMGVSLRRRRKPSNIAQLA